MPDANITKSALALSMKRLMSEKPFSKISVISICQGCGMNRKSFYYHFKDKYDLVNWIFYTDFINLVSEGSFESGWDLMAAVAELFYADQAFYCSAMKIEGQNSFHDYFQESMTPIVGFFIRDLLESEENIHEDEGEFLISFFCDAYLTVTLQWLERGCQVPPKEFIDKIKTVIRTFAANA